MKGMKDFGGDSSGEGVAVPSVRHQIVGDFASTSTRQCLCIRDGGDGNSLAYCFEWLTPSNQDSVAAAATVVFAPTMGCSKLDPAPTMGCSKNE
jgi:hypothetical protein